MQLRKTAENQFSELFLRGEGDLDSAFGLYFQEDQTRFTASLPMLLRKRATILPRLCEFRHSNHAHVQIAQRRGNTTAGWTGNRTLQNTRGLPDEEDVKATIERVIAANGEALYKMRLVDGRRHGTASISTLGSDGADAYLSA